jgi:hypothetical protein
MARLHRRALAFLRFWVAQVSDSGRQHGSRAETLLRQFQHCPAFKFRANAGGYGIEKPRNQDEQTQQTVAVLLRPMSAVSCCGIRPDPTPRQSTCRVLAISGGYRAVKAS